VPENKKLKKKKKKNREIKKDREKFVLVGPLSKD
jgi:hypothetical protein